LNLTVWELSIDQYLEITGIIIIPIIIAIIYKKRTGSKSNPSTNAISNFEHRIQKLEDSVIKNHIEIDEARLEIAYIKGMLNNG